MMLLLLSAVGSGSADGTQEQVHTRVFGTAKPHFFAT
jgi:hypothetical protein